jgi:hypothetical protein
LIYKYSVRKDAPNPGRNAAGQKKRGRPRSGPVSKEFIKDDDKRNDSAYKRKNTLLSKVIFTLYIFVIL